MAGEIYYDGGAPGWRLVVPDADDVSDIDVEVYSELFCLAEGPVLSFIANVHDQPDAPLVFHIALDLTEKAGRTCFFALDRHGRMTVETVSADLQSRRRTVIEPAREKLDLWLVSADACLAARPSDIAGSASDAYWEIMGPSAEAADYLGGWDAVAEHAREAGLRQAAPKPARPEPALEVTQTTASVPDDDVPDDHGPNDDRPDEEEPDADAGDEVEIDDDDSEEIAVDAAPAEAAPPRPGLARRIFGAYILRAILALIMLGTAGVILFSLGADILLNGVDPGSTIGSGIVFTALVVASLFVLLFRTGGRHRRQ